MKEERKQWIRKCPNPYNNLQCLENIIYKSKSHYSNSIKNNTTCKNCRYKKLSQILQGRKFSKKHRKNISDANKGKIRTYSNKKQISDKLKELYKTGERVSAFKFINNKGHNNPFYGKRHSEETKRKIRLSKIKRIERINGYCYPNFNPKACQIIDEYGKQNDYNFQHAMNGGEFYIKELGYWVDGYDKEKNVVIEYYEKHHNKRIKKDEERKKEIIKHLNCKFIEIKE